MVRELEIRGCIRGLSPEMTEEEFWNKMIDFVERNNWSFGGRMEMEQICGCISQVSPDLPMNINEFKQIFIGFMKHNNWSFDGDIKEY